MTDFQTATKFTTWGDVRGQGPVYDNAEAADRSLVRDQKACGARGGYSDREVYSIDDEGFLRDELGHVVYPASGRSHGAVRNERK